MKDIVKQWLERWKALPGSRKSIIVVMSLAVILAGLLFLAHITKKEYTPLFTGLEPKTASAVVDMLNQYGIPYQLAAEGTTIMVPKDQVYDIRIQLAGEGLLTNTGLGFELFADTKLGVTEFERRLDYQIALQEELRRTIVQLDEVEQARVHLVMPEKSVFVKEDRPASAAVTIAVKPLAKLSPEQIKGIIYLVSSSVENLPPENVKIINNNGVVLSDGILEIDSRSLTSQNLAQYEMRRALEKDLEERIQNMLERVLGLDNVVAMVTAELDFDQVEETSIEYGKDEDGQATLSQQITEEQSETTGTGGYTGVEGNIGVPYYPQAGQNTDTYSRNDTITNYLVDQTERRIVQAPGQIRRLSTAVVINGMLTAEQIERITSLVQTAVGFDAFRGDQITVDSMFFDAGEQFEPIPEVPDEEPEGQPIPLWQWIALGVAGLVLLILLVVMVRRRRKASAKLPEDLQLPPEEPVPLSKIVPEISMEEKIRVEKQKRISDIVREKPEDAVLLLRAWLSEE